MLAQAKQWKAALWLRPLTSSLMPPGGRLLSTFKGHPFFVTSVAVTPDGKRVVSSSLNNSLKVWNLETGKEQEFFALTGHTSSVLSLAVTPDGKWVISGSEDKTLKAEGVTSSSKAKRQSISPFKP